MTKEQRAQVWARKDQLFKALAQLPEAERQAVREQIEQCNQALVQEKAELMPRQEGET